MVPTMFSRLLRLPADVRDAATTFHRWRRIVHAAAPCPVPVKRAMIDWLGPIITEYYGATEGNGFTFCDSRRVAGPSRHCGPAPILGELLILDDEGDECPTGVDGTIWFRGATNFEYFDDPEKTAASRSADGSTSTVGDVGHVDEDGYLYLTDRKSYMIISGGVNIYPQETENLLITHPAVADAAVIGVPNEDLGEEVKAVVAARRPRRRRPGARRRADRLLPGQPGPFQVPADGRFRGRAAPAADRQAVQTAAPRSLLGGSPDVIL